MSGKPDGAPPAYGGNVQQPPQAYGGYPQPGPDQYGNNSGGAANGYYGQQQPMGYYPPQQQYQQYPPQGQYPSQGQYQDERGRKNDGCLTGCLAAMACCCCLDILF